MPHLFFTAESLLTCHCFLLTESHVSKIDAYRSSRTSSSIEIMPADMSQVEILEEAKFISNKSRCFIFIKYQLKFSHEPKIIELPIPALLFAFLFRNLCFSKNQIGFVWYVALVKPNDVVVSWIYICSQNNHDVGRFFWLKA